MIRQYDPSTEEVSPDPVDDEATVRNLLGQLRRGGAGPGDPRFADYAAVVGRDKQADWRELTDCISPGILRRRGIAEGGKLVPGAYNGDDLAADPPRGGSDGMSVAYPPIPVIAVGASPPQPPSHHRVHHHPGTKSYLSRLEPGQRTRLLLDPHPCAQVLGALLRDYYGGSWRDLIGDVQLSYLLFLHLHCFASLEHWRDLVAMLSLVDPRRLPSASTTSCPPDLRRVASEDLYPRLMGTLARQAEAVDEDFFDDAELSGDNALVPSLARLLRMRHDNVDDDGAAAALRSARDSLRGTLRRRFPSQFPPEGGPVASSAMDAGPRDDDEEEEDSLSGNDSVAFEYQDDEEEEEEDGPAVVASDELDASLARIAADRAATAAGSFGVGGGPTVGYSSELRDRYPVLFAALLPTEDVVMTCARALDDANDVSLVREAADYLQNVEARSGGEGPPIP
jgi:A1 cistron-splicing factor AAR2